MAVSRGGHGGSAARQRTASVAVTFCNLLKSFLGAGILGLPYAFRMSGIAAGVVLILVIGGVCAHTMFLLVSCKRHLHHGGAVAFADVAQRVLGARAALAVDALLVFTVHPGGWVGRHGGMRSGGC